MNAQYAQAIVNWHYEPPYDFYDMDQDPEDLADFLDPRSWHEHNFAVVNEHEELLGFFSFTREQGDTLEIGLGMRPDLTGQGQGRAFLEAGLAYARQSFAPASFSLKVATFNVRAIRLHQRVGFQPRETFMQPTNGSVFEFLKMTMPD